MISKMRFDVLYEFYQPFGESRILFRNLEDEDTRFEVSVDGDGIVFPTNCLIFETESPTVLVCKVINDLYKIPKYNEREKYGRPYWHNLKAKFSWDGSSIAIVPENRNSPPSNWDVEVIEDEDVILTDDIELEMMSR